LNSWEPESCYGAGVIMIVIGWTQTRRISLEEVSLPNFLNRRKLNREERLKTELCCLQKTRRKSK